ncbi:1-aminocyclopropane-1-carboxylate deaminase [Poseidonibacter lekithochrous]|uniref:1-aminocyclopropane-1-carboxylate deaminase n=1 Tax=Poseidonibacter lekithochrous TaxID=1904463 RepID=UPI0008FC9C61|nr:1-aminocyclopropane-1-carboxylate deaminase [Poseidonibacter lekithochrous]QKJ21929.1 1-aminocyclopropane-1-carboxylate deaminase [Poseidonibacter lekithochrous]
MTYTNSPIEKINFNNHEIFVKRDDLLDVDFSGNKARKFYYFLKHDFPNITKIVSHGSAQSNAMYSLSVLCKLRGWKFDYYVDHIASYIKESPSGNYKESLKNGMNIHEEEFPKQLDENTMFINEGGALKEAQYGLEVLAQEIITWAEQNSHENLKVFLPSGTGTTALFLQKFLPFPVLTCACVGDEKYLEKQFNDLEKTNHPIILQRKKKYHFGKLYKEFYETHKDLLEQTNIEFDFLYDSLGFIVLEDYLNSLEDNNSKILYIHQGGILGNISMLERYKHKYEKEV